MTSLARALPSYSPTSSLGLRAIDRNRQAVRWPAKTPLRWASSLSIALGDNVPSAENSCEIACIRACLVFLHSLTYLPVTVIVTVDLGMSEILLAGCQCSFVDRY